MNNNQCNTAKSAMSGSTVRAKWSSIKIPDNRWHDVRRNVGKVSIHYTLRHSTINTLWSHYISSFHYLASFATALRRIKYLLLLQRTFPTYLVANLCEKLHISLTDNQRLAFIEPPNSIQNDRLRQRSCGATSR